ncbi:MAG: CBS domain-containing protein [bacterium]|nr:CBS domain-containing protein [bacterium]MCP4800904.1 CBS domain-containing protein [bacterium]
MTKVSDILTAKGGNIHSIEPETTVYDAIAKMVELGIGSLLVIEDETVSGIITERDYLSKVALKNKNSRDTKVGEVMSHRIIYLTPDNDVEDVMAMMTEAHCRHMPVIDSGKLCGLISIGDCAKQLSQDRQTQLNYLTEYIADNYPG